MVNGGRWITKRSAWNMAGDEKSYSFRMPGREQISVTTGRRRETHFLWVDLDVPSILFLGKMVEPVEVQVRV